VNPYDDLLAAEEQRLSQASASAMGVNPPAPPVPASVQQPANPYDDILASEDIRQQAVLRTAAQTNPDQAGEAARLARRYPAPQDVLLRNLQDVKLQAAVEDASKNLLSAPALARQMQSLPFAQVAHDDTENLSLIEGTLRAAKAGIYSAAGGVAGAFRAGFEGLASLQELNPIIKAWEESGAFGGNPARRLAEGFGLIAEKNRSDAAAARPQGSSILEQGYYSGIESLSQQGLSLPLAFTPGGAAATLTSMGVFTGGDAYQQARQAGIPHDRALMFAASQAAIEVATEEIPLLKLVGDVKAGTPLRELVVRQLASEIPGEQVATLLQDLNEWAVLNPEKPFADYLKERPSAAAQTLIATIVGTGGNIAVSGTVNAAADAVARRQAKAAKAEDDAQRIEQLNALATASKVLQRDPETFAKFVEAASEDGQVKDVYISAEALAQSGVADQVAAASPAVAAQFSTALETGGDIRIPVAEYASTIASQSYAQNLVDHLKVEADGLSRAEAKEVMRTQGEELRRQVEEALAGYGEQARASRQAVEAKVLEQLQATKRFTDQVNSQYASLVGAFYGTQAERLGTTAEDLYQRYPLRVQAQAPVGEALPQGERGFFSPASNTITLLKTADLSTFAHEFGHAQLEMLTGIASHPTAPAEIKADMGALLDWFGVKAEGPDGALAAWNRMTLDEKRQHHEQFARGFEAYLFEGKAPSVELRGVFQRFRAWLINVYRNLKALNVELTDEVRGVMDRLLAAEDQIRDAEAAASMGMLFRTPEEAAKFGVEWQAYHDQTLAATAEAMDLLTERGAKDMQWLSRAKNRELKRLQKAAEAKRKEVEAEVRAEVMARPVYQAWAYLTGKHPVGPVEADRYGKLNTYDVRARYGTEDGSVARILAERGMLKSDGEDPDITAELFGYDSGDAMMQGLAAARPPEEVVADLTDQRMLERHGDITSPEALETAANEAVHNAARAKFIATELKALEKANDARRDAGTDKKGRPRTAAIVPEAARQFAADLIARLKVRDVSPAQYQAAEARAAREAAKAFRAGDVIGAAREKRNQLINHYATKEALAAQSEVAKALKYFARVVKSEGVDSEYRDQIDQLLERYALKSESKKDADKRKSLQQWVEDQRGRGFEPDIPPEILAGLGKTSYRDMTVEEVRGLVDTVKQIEHLGRLKSKLLTAKDQRDYESIRDEMADSIEANARGRTADTRTPTTNTGRWLQGLKNFGAAHIKAATWARIFDGGQDGGPVWEHLIRPANERGDWETTRRAEATQRLHEILKSWRSEGKVGGKGSYFPSIGRSLNRESVLAIALNTGNSGNLQRLLGGEGWTLEQVRPVLDTLTESDWQVVQQVWDYFESFRQEISAKERRVYGREPKWVEPTPVVTKFGTLKGGYYPIKYDTAATARAQENADAEEAAALLKGAHNAATTRRSFTKSRVESVQGRPLVYTLQGLYSGVNDVIHDLAWHEWLIDANRLLRSEKIDAAIREHYGPAVVRQLHSWRDDIAIGDARANHAIDQFSAFVRRNVSLAGLALNVKSALMQPLGFTQTIVRIGGKAAAQGIKQYIANPVAATRSVNAQSEFMRNRARTRFRELNEIRGQVQGGNTIHEKMAPYAYVLMLRVQQMVDVPTWLGAYEKAITAGNDQERSVALADQAVIDSQGGGQFKDLAAIERGGPTQKLFTVFYAFMNTALNLGVAQGMSPRSAARKAADMLMLYTVPALLGKALADALTPGDAGDDDELVKKLILTQAEYLLGLIVGLRELAPTLRALTGQPGADYQGPAGLRPLIDLGKFAQQAHQGEFDDSFRKATVNLTADMFGLPGAQINRTITGAEALNEGKTENPAALVMGYQEPH
jgi:hypothetical protein